MQQIHILGIPFDGKSSYAGGPRFAPARIREEMQSSAYNAYSENLSPVLGSEMLMDCGDIRVQSYEELLPAIKEKITAKKKHLFLGGDHSITYPVVEALHVLHGPFHILHFDAHCDLYDEFEGDRFSHACPFARIMENNLATSLTQVGIRTMTPHQMEQSEKFGVEVYEMRHVAHFDTRTLEGPLYISIDLDVLDPVLAPGISHREPGGLSLRSIIDWLQEIDVPIIGADIVEYNPLRDVDGITASVCVKVVKELLDALRRSPWPPEGGKVLGL
jgi:agmatinase